MADFFDVPREPTLREAYADVGQDIKQFQTLAARIAEGMEDPAQRRRIEGLLADFQKAFTEVEKAVPTAMDSLDEKHAKQQDRLRACEAKARALQQRLAELKARKPPEKPAPAPLDPLHGATLRREVLERFADRPRGVAPAPSGDVASMSSTTWAEPASQSSASIPAHPVKPSESATEKPRREEVGDMSSDAWKGPE